MKLLSVTWIAIYSAATIAAVVGLALRLPKRQV
jgi:hypothetical protein